MRNYAACADDEEQIAPTGQVPELYKMRTVTRSRAADRIVARSSKGTADARI
jgi:hypothetical protein